MNQNEAKWASACMPLVKAHAEGRTIQLNRNWRRPAEAPDWWDTPTPDWSCGPDAYRVKPEPREFWLNIYPQDGGTYVHHSYEAARAGCDHRESIPTIKVVEVL